MNTRESLPVHQVPYKSPDAIKHKVKAEVDSLLASSNTLISLHFIVIHSCRVVFHQIRCS